MIRKYFSILPLSLLIIALAAIVAWRYYSMGFDGELRELEQKSAASEQNKAGQYGTYDSFLKQLIKAKRVFFVMPPFVSSDLDSFMEGVVARNGYSFVCTEKRNGAFFTICDVIKDQVPTDDNGDEIGGSRKIRFADFGWYGEIDISAIIWVPIRNGVAAMYFVDSGRRVIRKEILRN